MRAIPWPVSLTAVDPAPRPAARPFRRLRDDGAAAMLDALPVAAALLDPRGAVRHANPALLGLLAPHGRPRAGTPFLSLVSPASGDVAAECLAGVRGAAEVILAAPAGAGTFHLSLAELPGRLRAAFLHLPAPPPNDEAERLRALGQLAGGVAHDMNNLLGVVLGALDAARLAVPEVTAALAPAQDAAERGAALAHRLLAVARRQVLTPRVVELDAAMAGAADLIRSVVGPGIALALELDAPGRRVRVDPSQLDQVLLNLAANARDAMGGRGTLTLATGGKVALREEPGTPDPLPPGRWTVLSVSDTGPGIRPADLPRLVEPFFSTKRGAGGTGLGLATVHGIVRQSGGALQVDPTGAPGARFRIHLPRHEGEAELAPAPAVPVRPTTLHVLLVEDEPLLRRLSVAALKRAGHRVTEAPDAEEALERLEEGLAPDLLVSDVALPGQDGLALARAARALRPGLRVILASGYAAATLDTDLVAEDIAFLSKPYRASELLALVSGPA